MQKRLRFRSGARVAAFSCLHVCLCWVDRFGVPLKPLYRCGSKEMIATSERATAQSQKALASLKAERGKLEAVRKAVARTEVTNHATFWIYAPAGLFYLGLMA